MRAKPLKFTCGEGLIRRRKRSSLQSFQGQTIASLGFSDSSDNNNNNASTDSEPNSPLATHKHDAEMASSLRKRLSRKQNIFEQGPASDSDSRPSSNSSSEDFESLLARRPKIRAPSASAGTSPSPPPPPPKSPSRQPNADVSPPRTLLDRYKHRGVRLVRPSNQPMLTHPSRDGEDAAGEEINNIFRGQPTSSSASTAPPTKAESLSDTRTFGGVQFEMLSKDKASEGPTGVDAQTTNTHSTRITRSHSRRQQRVDSVESDPLVKDFALGSDDLAPPEGTLSKDQSTSRTPSQCVLASPITTEPPSPDEIAITPTPKSRHTRSTSQLLSFSYGSTPSKIPGRSPPDPLLSPLPLNFAHLSKPSGSENASLCPTPVVPPIPTEDTPPFAIWTSNNMANSRPIEAWLPAKRWTCCKCTTRSTGSPAAQTIVEQKMCSRLECGHERCRNGCRVTFGAAFMGY